MSKFNTPQYTKFSDFHNIKLFENVMINVFLPIQIIQSILAKSGTVCVLPKVFNNGTHNQHVYTKEKKITIVKVMGDIILPYAYTCEIKYWGTY